MKRILVYTLCAAMALTSAACGAKDTGSTAETAAPTESATLPEIPEGAITDESGSFFYAGELKQGGDDENGYIQIPYDYVRFQEEGVEGLTQYSDVTGTNIITLDHYDNINYQDAANSLRYYMEEEPYIEGLSGASVKVAGYNSLQLYCHFTDDNKFLVTWLIEDPADPADCYYLAIEFANEDSGIMACSSTFQTVTDHNNSAQ